MSEVVDTGVEAASVTTGQRILFKVGQLVVRAITVAMFGLRIVGRDRLPVSGGYVVAPGAHRSIIDTPVTAIVSRRMFRFMGAESYFDIPVLGWFLRAAGGFPVERGTTDREALRLAEAVLASGDPLVVFPEATRHSGPEVQPLKDGAAFLAARARVPIVPIGIGGGEKVWPKGQRLPRPGRMRVIVGSPIHPVPRAPGERVKRSEVRRLTTELHAALQQLFDEASAVSDRRPTRFNGRGPDR